MIPSPRQLLGNVHGGRVLDAATGAGGFVTLLVDGLAEYAEIIGIDLDASRGERFREAHARAPRIRFEQRDAAATGYPDGTFDTVAIANSLHHVADPLLVLHELRRVLRPGGTLIVFEMHCDGQEPPEQTHVELHHWWASVDTRRGILHRPTYPREEIAHIVGTLELDFLVLTDVAFPEDDPLDPDSLAEIDEVIDRYLAWADGEPSLVERGQGLRHRLHRVGIRGARSLAAIGRKPVAGAA